MLRKPTNRQEQAANLDAINVGCTLFFGLGFAVTSYVMFDQAYDDAVIWTLIFFAIVATPASLLWLLAERLRTLARQEAEDSFT